MSSPSSETGSSRLDSMDTEEQHQSQSPGASSLGAFFSPTPVSDEAQVNEVMQLKRSISPPQPSPLFEHDVIQPSTETQLGISVAEADPPIKQEEEDFDLTWPTEQEEQAASMAGQNVSDPVAVVLSPASRRNQNISRADLVHTGGKSGQQLNRSFLVPSGVVRTKIEHFPTIDQELEFGMVAYLPGCKLCKEQGVHCTYGAGIDGSGKERLSKDGKRCDFCTFRQMNCVDHGGELRRRPDAGSIPRATSPASGNPSPVGRNVVRF